KITKGTNGWGGPLTLKSTPERQYVISVTGGGIHPVAQEIARITGATVVDSFKNPVPNEETIAAVIDCGGVARAGTYPKLGIATINVKVMSPSGPLAKFITEDIFVSGVSVDNIQLIDESDFSDQEDAASATKANDAEIDTDSQSVAEVTKRTNGWGGPLTLKSTPERQYVISVTGGGIHPVAQEIARIKIGRASCRYRKKKSNLKTAEESKVTEEITRVANYLQ